jgi:hypothetical protein
MVDLPGIAGEHSSPLQVLQEVRCRGWRPRHPVWQVCHQSEAIKRLSKGIPFDSRFDMSEFVMSLARFKSVVNTISKGVLRKGL